MWNKGSLGGKGGVVSQLPPPPSKGKEASPDDGDGNGDVAATAAKPPPTPIHKRGVAHHRKAYNWSTAADGWRFLKMKRLFSNETYTPLQVN